MMTESVSTDSSYELCHTPNTIPIQGSGSHTITRFAAAQGLPLARGASTIISTSDISWCLGDVIEIICFLAIILMIMKGTIMCIYWLEYKGSSMITKAIKNAQHTRAIKNTVVINDIESQTAQLTFHEIVYRKEVPHVPVYFTEHGEKFHSRRDFRGMQPAKRTFTRVQCRVCWPGIKVSTTIVSKDTVHIE